MAPPEAAQNQLTSRFAELESLTCLRPASILVTEYLAALTAENVLDAASAARVAAAYHRLHYGAVEANDPEMRDAAEGLHAAAVRIEEMSGESRHTLAERISRRLQAAQTVQAPPAARTAAEPPETPAGLEWDLVATNCEPGNGPLGKPESLPRIPLAHDAAPKPPTRRRTLRINSVPLETATLVVVGLFFAGYILRGGAEQSIATTQAEAPAPGRPHVVARDVWKHDDYWAANLRQRAQTEAAQKRDRTARLAFELLITEVPRDAGALNDLAWLYLTSSDVSVRDPQRGLELALRAVALSRTPSILDTAAEAQFQTGHVDQAVKLEREALNGLPRFAGFENRAFWDLLRRQLEKFQSASKSARSGTTSAPPS